MISKCSLTTLLLINSMFVFSQKQVEGVWKTQDQKDSLLVCASGESNPAVFVYFPSKAKFLPFTIGNGGTELIHYEPDASKMVLTVSADGKTLTDPNATSGKKVYSRTSANSPINSKSIAAGPDDFFDFSTDNYYAGINFYLSSHPGLPFMPNSAFIAKRKVSTVKIEKYFSRVSSAGVQAQKEFDLVYNFNSAGQITTVQVIPYGNGQQTDTWTFTYSGDKLTKINSPGRVMEFDKDNWEVDARQQKKVPFIYPSWNYYGSSKPKTATLPYMTGTPLNEYYYNDANQLVKICSKDVSEPNILEHCTEYTYDKNGLPVKIVETKRSK